jgi:DNA-binding NarL/FixJ family response regulator
MSNLSRNKDKTARKSYVTILRKKNAPNLNEEIRSAEERLNMITVTEPTSRLTDEELDQQMLTHRQQETLRLLAQGFSNKQIAQQLNISVKTVDAHRASIMTRLRIHNLAGLVKYAIRTGLTTLE